MEPRNTEYKTLIIEDTEYKTQLSNKFVNRPRWEKDNPAMLKSFIPGTIREIFIKEGQQMLEGDNVLILEAMKMRNKMVAPIDGIVKEIRVKSGDIVPKNELLIVFEPTAETE